MSPQETPPLYHGLYINLERSDGRRARFEASLARLGLTSRYGRLAAVDGKSLSAGRSTITPGQFGCFLSHVRALEEARGRGVNIHILEDDAILSEHTEPVISDAIARGLLDRFDILFTDTLVDCNVPPLKAMKAAFDKTAAAANRPMKISDFQILDLSRQNFACLTSYVVGLRSIDKILALYRQELGAGPRIPVDLFIRDAVHAGKLRAACVFPFVTSFALEEIAGSTIDEREGRLENPSVMVLAALRYSFFLARDLSYAKRHLDAATKVGRSPADAHHELIVQALEYVMSGDFQEF